MTTHLVDSNDFRRNANIGLADVNLQKALAGMEDTFVAGRARAAAALPEFEALRDAAKAIKDHALADLDFYLERFAGNVEKAGGHVHWCVDAESARKVVLDLCRKAGARTVTKGKTMIGEERRGDPHQRSAAGKRQGAGGARSWRIHHPASPRDAEPHHRSGHPSDGG